MMRKIQLLIVLLLISGCATEPLPTPTATLRPSETATETATIVWFPPTETPTITVTVATTPTQELRPNIGPLLLEDDFSEPEKWSLASTNNSSATVSNNKLTLALSRQRAFLMTTRLEPNLKNFYAEVTASPNLCEKNDEFGVIVRATISLDHFRLGLTCNGQARVDRIYKGSQLVFKPLETFGALPTTLLTERRIAVWAYKDDLRFFVNNQLIYTVRDTVFYQGALGMFVKTSQEGSISVNFSNLVIHEITP